MPEALELKAALKARQHLKSDLVFCDAGGTPFTQSAIEAALRFGQRARLYSGRLLERLRDYPSMRRHAVSSTSGVVSAVARGHFEAALDLARNAAERGFLARRIGECCD